MAINIEEVIIEANKAGARGLQIVAVIPPQNPTEIDYILIYKPAPEMKGASDLPWYLKSGR